MDDRVDFRYGRLADDIREYVGHIYNRYAEDNWVYSADGDIFFNKLICDKADNASAYVDVYLFIYKRKWYVLHAYGENENYIKEYVLNIFGMGILNDEIIKVIKASFEFYLDCYYNTNGSWQYEIEVLTDSFIPLGGFFKPFDMNIYDDSNPDAKIMKAHSIGVYREKHSILYNGETEAPLIDKKKQGKIFFSIIIALLVILAAVIIFFILDDLGLLTYCVPFVMILPRLIISVSKKR
ncbi:MAG: hypothetical protein IJV15_13930 [Lachnospiraceae bacterium]|nr:hypothetical protein [Lachnospiraceae bacterium]